MKLKPTIAIALTILLQSCATPYQPVGFIGGYDSIHLGGNLHKVSFRGNGFTSQEDAERKTLRRCAEITISNGCKYFTLVGGGTEIKNTKTYTPGFTSINTTSNSSTYGNSNFNGEVTGNYISGGGSYYGQTTGNSNTNIITSMPQEINIEKPKTEYLIRISKTAEKNSIKAINLLLQ